MIPLYITIAQILLSVTVPQKRSASSELCEDYNAKEAPQSDTSSEDDFVQKNFTGVKKKVRKVLGKASDQTVPLKKQGKILTLLQKLRSNTYYFFRLGPTKRNTEPKHITTTGGGSSSTSSLRKPPVEPGIYAPYGPAGADPDIIPGNYFDISLNYILTFYLHFFSFQTMSNVLVNRISV